MRLKTLLLVGCLPLLAACGSVTNSSGNTGNLTSSPSSTESLASALQAARSLGAAAVACRDRVSQVADSLKRWSEDYQTKTSPTIISADTMTLMQAITSLDLFVRANPNVAHSSGDVQQLAAEDERFTAILQRIYDDPADTDALTLAGGEMQPWSAAVQAVADYCGFTAALFAAS